MCMRVNRFFVNKPLGEETFTDDSAIVHQIKHVLRLQPGDTVSFFNGKDSYNYLYRIVSLDKHTAVFCLLEKSSASLSIPTTIVFLSVIRKELFEIAALKMTELGVSHIFPVLSDKTERRFLDIHRLEKIVIEGAEQCGRMTVPEIGDYIELTECAPLLEKFSVKPGSIFSLSLFGTKADALCRTKEASEALAFFVGPEGGWSAREELFFEEKGIQKILVSPHTLRAETAAIICAYLPFFMRK